MNSGYGVEDPDESPNHGAQMPRLETEELGEWGPVRKKDHGPVGPQRVKGGGCKEESSSQS